MSLGTFLLSWYLIGLVLMVFFFWLDWLEGVDVTLDAIIKGAILSIAGPIVFFAGIFALVEDRWDNWTTYIVIPGRKKNDN